MFSFKLRTKTQVSNSTLFFKLFVRYVRSLFTHKRDFESQKKTGNYKWIYFSRQTIRPQKKLSVQSLKIIKTRRHTNTGEIRGKKLFPYGLPYNQLRIRYYCRWFAQTCWDKRVWFPWRILPFSPLFWSNRPPFGTAKVLNGQKSK